MSGDQKKEFRRPAIVASLGLQALAGYAASDLVQENDSMFRDMVQRLAQAADKDRWP